MSTCWKGIFENWKPKNIYKNTKKYQISMDETDKEMEIV